MEFSDSIYGRHEITEPVILELLESPAVLRLKGISQAGVPVKYNVPGLIDVSRYDHSFGVFLLLRKLDASIEEQIAGLLHDISHLAFSHVADWLFHDGGAVGSQEDYHELIKEKFIANTDIPEIIGKYGFDSRAIFDEDRYSLLERPLPELCADRLDYSIREIHNQLEIQGSTFSNNLALFEGQIIFTDQDIATLFAEKFLYLQKSHWGSASDAIRFSHFVKALTIALKGGMIQEADFFGTEKPIMDKIENSGNEEIKRILSNLKDSSFEDKVGREGVKVYKKFRYVDPKISIEGNPKNLSAIDGRFLKALEIARFENSQGIIV